MAGGFNFNFGFGNVSGNTQSETVTVGNVSFTYQYGGAAAPLALPAPAAVATSTGVNPVENSYSLYGHTIPLTVFGRGRIGCEIIAGPTFNNGTASFIVSAGVPADPSGTRVLEEIAFDSEVVWSGSLTGAGTPTSSGFTVEPFTCRFYDGKLTQAADALETSAYGAKANAYRPQILLAVENLPLANTKFKKIPYIALLISDTSGEDVNYGEAFERLAASPWVNLAGFETLGITDGLANGGLIFAQDAQFLQTLQQFGRFYPNWDILQTDKLRVVDRGAVVAADIVLDTTRLMDKVVVTRAGPDTITKDLELSTIDNGADYTIVPSVAQRPRDPVAVTTSVGKDAAYLPAIMDAFTRTAVVTFTKYYEENARKTISGTAMAYGLEIEPGVLVSIDPGGDFGSEVFKIKETTRGANNVVEFIGQSILRCSLGAGEVGCSEATAFLARTSGLDATHTSAYIALICGLVSDGVWSKFDMLHIYATQDSTTAKLNLVSTSYPATLVASPGAVTFLADTGFQGPGTSDGWIGTGFNPTTATSPKFVQNSGHVSIWSQSTIDTPAGNFIMGSSNSTVSQIGGHAHFTDGNAYFTINNASPGISAAVANADYHYLANRSSSTNLQGYKNGSLLASSSSVSSVTPPNLEVIVLGQNRSGAPVGAPLNAIMASIGSSLNSTDVTNFHNRLRTYMTAVGVP